MFWLNLNQLNPKSLLVNVIFTKNLNFETNSQLESLENQGEEGHLKICEKFEIGFFTKNLNDC